MREQSTHTTGEEFSPVVCVLLWYFLKQTVGVIFADVPKSSFLYRLRYKNELAALASLLATVMFQRCRTATRRGTEQPLHDRSSREVVTVTMARGLLRLVPNGRQDSETRTLVELKKYASPRVVVV